MVMENGEEGLDKEMHYGSEKLDAETSNYLLSHQFKGSGARQRNELCKARKWISRARDPAKGRASGPALPCRFLVVLNKREMVVSEREWIGC